MSVLVIGDIIVDRYIRGTVDRISPEAPVPVVAEQKIEARPGGAANVAANAKAMGSNTILVGVVGVDWESLHCPRDPQWFLFPDSTRPTTVKTRVVANGQQIVRVDREKRHAVSEEVENNIIAFIDVAVSAEVPRVVVVSDYRKGVITRKLMDRVRGIEPPPAILVDPGSPDWSLYSGATLIKPNEREWFEYQGNGVSPASACEALVPVPGAAAAGAPRYQTVRLERLRPPSALVTRGARGMTLIRGPSQVSDIPARARDVIDVTGAGDTVIAAIASYLDRNPEGSLLKAARFANAAASVVVGKSGTAVASQEEIPEWG